MDASLSLDTPFLRRLFAWQRERFPSDAAIAGSLFYVAAMLCGRASVTQHGEPLSIGTKDLLGLCASICFLLMIRVFDEHKDYRSDVRNYPERVLSRGLVTLDQLKLVGALAISVQLAAALAADGGVGRATWMWLVMFGYSLLMLREFFVREWLEKRLVLYAGSHLAITPLSMLWYCQMGAGQHALPSFVIPFAFVSFFGGAAYELTRKTRGPEEERPGVDSYTKTLGQRGAVLAIMAVLLGGLAAGVVLLQALAPALPWLALTCLGLGFLAASASVLAFARAPSEAARKRNEKLVGLFLVIGQLAPASVVVAARGLAWG